MDRREEVLIQMTSSFESLYVGETVEIRVVSSYCVFGDLES